MGRSVFRPQEIVLHLPRNRVRNEKIPMGVRGDRNVRLAGQERGGRGARRAIHEPEPDLGKFSAIACHRFGQGVAEHARRPPRRDSRAGQFVPITTIMSDPTLLFNSEVCAVCGTGTAEPRGFMRVYLEWGRLEFCTPGCGQVFNHDPARFHPRSLDSAGASLRSQEQNEQLSTKDAQDHRERINGNIGNRRIFAA